jgi:hypothetical protein
MIKMIIKNADNVFVGAVFPDRQTVPVVRVFYNQPYNKSERDVYNRPFRAVKTPAGAEGFDKHNIPRRSGICCLLALNHQVWPATTATPVGKGKGLSRGAAP